jgi:predicted RNase H-like nuclease (RuvC/YqgF family)
MENQMESLKHNIALLRDEIQDVKDELKKQTEILVRLANVETRFEGIREELQANKKSHDMVWGEIKKIQDRCMERGQECQPVIGWVKETRKWMWRIVVSLIIYGAVGLGGWFLYLYKRL